MKFDKWVLLAIVAAVFNPLPTGVLAGLVLLSEKKYKTEAIVVLVLSAFLLALTIYLVSFGPLL